MPPFWQLTLSGKKIYKHFSRWQNIGNFNKQIVREILLPPTLGKTSRHSTL